MQKALKVEQSKEYSAETRCAFFACLKIEMIKKPIDFVEAQQL